MQTRSRKRIMFNKACFDNDYDTVEKLIDFVDISIPYGKKFNNSILLTNIIKEENTRLMKLLACKGCDLEVNTVYYTPLMYACSLGNNKIAKILIENGANTESRNEFLDTPLILATEKGNLELVKILLENGADIEARNLFGMKSYFFYHDDKNNRAAIYVNKAKKWRKNRNIMLVYKKSNCKLKELPVDLIRYSITFLD